RRKPVDRVSARRPRHATHVDRDRDCARGRLLPRIRASLRGGRQLMRSLRVAWIFFRVSAMNELQYRTNFFVAAFQSLLSVGVALIVLRLVYSHTSQLNGWNQSQLLCVLGIQILLGGVVHAAIQPNMQRLVDEVRDGKLDYVLTKPEDAQAIVSVRQVEIWQADDVISGVIVLIVGVSQLQASIGVGDALAFAVLLVLG